MILWLLLLLLLLDKKEKRKERLNSASWYVWCIQRNHKYFRRQESEIHSLIQLQSELGTQDSYDLGS